MLITLQSTHQVIRDLSRKPPTPVLAKTSAGQQYAIRGHFFFSLEMWRAGCDSKTVKAPCHGGVGDTAGDVPRGNCGIAVGVARSQAAPEAWRRPSGRRIS